LFVPPERLAADDKVRLGWRVSGPMYGVCAATQSRRRELMWQCLAVINQEFQLSLALLSGQPTSSASSALTSPTSSQCRTPCSSLGDSAEFPGGDLFAQRNISLTSRPAPLDLGSALPLQPAAHPSAPPQHESLSSDSSPTYLDSTQDPIRSSIQWSVLTNQSCSAQHDKTTNVALKEPVLQPPRAFHESTGGGLYPLQIPAVATLGRVDDGAHVDRNQPTAQPRKKHDDEAVAAHEDVVLPVPRPQPAELAGDIQTMCACVGVTATVRMQALNDGILVSLRPAEANSTSSPTIHESMRRVDIARDMLIARYGSGPFLLRLAHAAALQRQLLQQPRSAAGNHHAIQVVQGLLDVTCRYFLLRGESISVTSVEMSGPPATSQSATHVTFAVRGLKGRGLARRAAAIKALVEECLGNVQTLGSALDEHDASENAHEAPRTCALTSVQHAVFMLAADLHGVYLASTTVLHDNTVLCALVVGPPSSVDALIGELALLGGGGGSE
jgi:hypothetical protein